MGNIVKYVTKPLESNIILILGLPNCGKTSILYQFKLKEKVYTVPTHGCNVESFSHNRKNFTAYDIQYTEDLLTNNENNELFSNVKVLVFVVDKSDKNKLKLAKEFLSQVLEKPEFDNKPILVIVNKSDVETDITAADIADRLSLYDIKCREWFIRETSSLKGDGLKASLDWISKFN
jgi:GTPase SAR1 family protein